MSSLTASRMSYAAAIVASVTYGIYVVLAGITLHYLVVRRHRATTQRQILIGYTTVMLVIQTIYFISGAKWSEIEFVESSVNPGEFAGQLSSRLAVLKDTTYTVNIWLADSLILYRTFVIYGGYRLILLFPFLLFLGAFATGIGLLIETAKPGAAFGQASVINFGTPFWSLSVATNVLCTVLIVIRLLYCRGALNGRRQEERDGRETTRQNKPSAFNSEVAIFIESGALYAICALIYIPLFAKNIPLQFPFSALLGSAAGIAPNLIILRMSLGKAITRDWSQIPMRDWATTQHVIVDDAKSEAPSKKGSQVRFIP
ncbi:hypothetical protein BU17DRAFT_52563 [Hysterangium stoloniferum]|nr:hypothetical protein BU17DRAFT_52563 [Hysterangium stoloniferum]